MNGPAQAPRMTGSLILSNTALGLLGLALTAVAVLQQLVLDVPNGVHTAIVIIVTVVASLGVTSQDAARLGALIPHGVVVALTTVVTALVAVEGLSDVGKTWHAVIAGVVTLIAAVGINPTSPVTPVPPPQR